MDRDGRGQAPAARGDVLPPRFLGADAPAAGQDADRLQALADWVADPDNPFFARAQANRVWYHLMGRGMVEPNDDFRDSNPPANGPLLDALANDFVAPPASTCRHLVRHDHELADVPALGRARTRRTRTTRRNFSHGAGPAAAGGAAARRGGAR